ncbi:MAG: hypothetical protein MI861_04595 [Pirellulales bacterium]|nr:hypothetical protein [Pirellulales bacterium]
MTTSSDHPSPTEPTATADHWLELTALLDHQSTHEFGNWIDEELAQLEEELRSFVTNNSLSKSLRQDR